MLSSFMGIYGCFLPTFVYFPNAFLVCFSSLPKVAIPKNDDDKWIAQIVAISLALLLPRNSCHLGTHPNRYAV